MLILLHKRETNSKREGEGERDWVCICKRRGQKRKSDREEGKRIKQNGKNYLVVHFKIYLIKSENILLRKNFFLFQLPSENNFTMAQSALAAEYIDYISAEG